MTLHEYLEYPMGKGAAAMMVHEAKAKMIERFLLVEDQIKVSIYTTGKTLVFHFEIPSESTKGLFYDAVIEVPYTKDDLNMGNNIFGFPLKVYSNSPSFIYSYAYVFYQRRLICDWLVNRYERKTLTTPPKQRNEFGIIFYEKSIFFALYYISKNFNMSVMKLEGMAQKASHSSIKSVITSQVDIKGTRQAIQNAIREEKRKQSKSSSNPKTTAEIEDDVAAEYSARGVRKTTKPILSRQTKKPKGTKTPTKSH